MSRSTRTCPTARSTPARVGTILAEAVSGPATSIPRIHYRPPTPTTSTSVSEKVTNGRSWACSGPTSSGTGPRTRRLQPVLSGKGFIPIAIPEQDIRQAQLRYYRECGPGSPLLLATSISGTLGSAYQTVGGTTLWGPTVGDRHGRPTDGVTFEHAGLDCLYCGRRIHPGGRRGPGGRCRLKCDRYQHASCLYAPAIAIRRLLVSGLQYSGFQGQPTDDALVPGARVERTERRRRPGLCT